MHSEQTIDVPANSAASENASPAANARKSGRSARAIFLTWLRKTHLYVGLWGAMLGLLFGVTGFLLNHRAILKIPVTFNEQKSVQLPVPASPFSSPEDLSR